MNHLRQRSKISMPPSPTHELCPAEPCNHFLVTNNVLTDVVRQHSLLRPKKTSRTLGVWIRGLHPQRCPLLDSGPQCIGGGGGECTRPHEQGGVFGWHREHTFYSPDNFIGDRRQGRLWSAAIPHHVLHIPLMWNAGQALQFGSTGDVGSPTTARLDLW